MSCVTCGEASTRRDDSAHCTNCSTDHGWASMLDTIQGGNAASPQLDFDEQTENSGDASRQQPEIPTAIEESESDSIPESAPTLSPFAELHEDAPTSAAVSETLVDDSMLRAIEELAKNLETVSEVEEARARYADDVVEATESKMNASAPTSQPRYATEEATQQTPDSLAASVDELLSRAATTTSASQKADPFA